MDSRKYNTGALFIFPLVEDGDADFVGDYTPAAGDAKVWTDKLISTNLTSLILGFDSLSELPAQGAQLDENGAGTAEGVVEFTIIISGTVGGGDAAGFFIMRSVTGQAWSNNDQIDINGGTANIATADSTTYDLAATAGLIGIIGNGLFAAALSPTEMSCSQGAIHIVDSATKAIEDQAILFTTYGNASALHAFDLGTATQAVNVTQISGDSTAADNLELMYDGTGYVDPTAPSSRSQADAIGSAPGGSVNIQATSDNTGGAIIDSVTFVGSVQGGTTFANTEAEDGVLHDIDDTGSDIDIVYGFAVGGGRVGTEVSFAGFVQGNGDEMKIKVYDHVGSDWEIIGTIPGQNGTTNVGADLPLLLKHTGTGTELGNVYIRFDTDSTTPSNLSIDKLLVSAVSIGQSIGYEGGSIWINTALSNTNTEVFVDGVADNPVSTIAAAKTLSTALSIPDFHILNGSSITLGETTDNESYFGDNWTLDLSDESCAGAHFEGAVVSGAQTGTGCSFRFGGIGTVTLAADAEMDECHLTGTITLPVGAVFLDRCHHGGANPAILEFGAAVGSTTVHMHAYSGGVEIYNMGDSGTDILHLDGNGKLVVNANSSGGTINLRGNWEVTGSPGNVTINYDDTTSDVAAILVDTAVIGAAGAGLTDLGGMSTGMKAEVNAEVDDVITTDTGSEETSVPAAAADIRAQIQWLYQALRNKLSVTSTTKKVHIDNDSLAGTKTLSDNGTTYSETKMS